MQAQNQYLDYFIDASFQEVNSLFVFTLKNITDRTTHTHRILFSKSRNKGYTIMIYRRNFFDHPLKNDTKHMIMFKKLLLLVKQIIRLSLFQRKL